MSRRGEFVWIAAGILSIWSAHNALLRPLEAEHLPEAVLEPMLLAARVVVWMGPIAWYLRRHEGRRALDALAVTTPLRPAGALLGAVPAALYLALVASLAGLPTDRWSIALSIPSMAALVLGVVLEELLMRGFLFGQLSLWHGHRRALLLTAGLFAAMHLPGWIGEGRPAMEIAASSVVLLLLGLVLGIARWTSGSLWPPILLHVLNNLLGV